MTDDQIEQDLSSAITEITEPEEPQSPEPEQQETPALPEQPSIKDLARKYLKEKREQGENLTVKTNRVKVCKEIANKIQQEIGSCSYQAVAKEIPFVLKADMQNDETVQTDGNTIKKTKIELVKRPPRKIVNEEESQDTETSAAKSLSAKEKLQILAKLEEEGQSIQAMMWQFTLQDFADFIKVLGLPAPKTKRLMILAKRIAFYNEIQIKSGHPEKVIDISDKFMKLLLVVGGIGTFLHPIAKKFFPENKTKEDSQDLSSQLGGN